jgi:prepilin-type processing-associated H-X9-DG protein
MAVARMTRILLVSAPERPQGKALCPVGPTTRGVSRSDFIVMVVLIVLTVLIILMVLPRGREQARMASCQRNLAQIGKSLALYDQLEHQLPATGEIAGPDAPPEARPKSPLRSILETLQQPDLLGLKDATTLPQPRPGEVPGETPVPGFVCASDPNATAGRVRAPISYRAATGDTTAGDNGAFAPGHVLKLPEIQEGDGLGYTAAFSERLVGDNISNHKASWNYTIVPGPLPPLACPITSDASLWRGDAGSTWVRADYRTTLYNHALPPNSQPSCIDSGGTSAFMPASSGHVSGVNLLFLDGRVTVVRPTIDRKIWKEFARIDAADAE